MVAAASATSRRCRLTKRLKGGSLGGDEAAGYIHNGEDSERQTAAGGENSSHAQGL
jgi:hypothetical protein